MRSSITPWTVGRWIAEALALAGLWVLIFAMWFFIDACTAPAHAQARQELVPVTCQPIDVAVRELKERHAEAVRGLGMVDEMRSAAIWVNADETSWTIVVVDRSRDVMCAVAAGSVWRFFDAPAAQQGDPS